VGIPSNELDIAVSHAYDVSLGLLPQHTLVLPLYPMVVVEAAFVVIDSVEIGKGIGVIHERPDE